MVNFSCFDTNLSREEVSEAVWGFNPIVPNKLAARYAITVICILLVALGLPWNILVIANIVKKKLYVNQPTIMLLLNLAVINISVCVLVIPFNIVTGITGEFSFGDNDVTRCKVCQTGVIYLMLTFAGLNNFALLSVDRLIYIRMAVSYHRRITTKRITVAMVTAWLFSIAITCPTLIGFGELYFSTATGICTVNFSGKTTLTKNSYYLLFLCILTLIPLVTLIVANVWVMCIAQNYLIQRFKRTSKRVNKEEKWMKEYSAAQVNLIKVYVAVFLIYIFTWFPIVVRMILGIAERNRYSTGTQISGITAYLALLSQVVVHPTLQAFLIRSMRESISTCLCNTVTRLRGKSKKHTQHCTHVSTTTSVVGLLTSSMQQELTVSKA